MRVQLSFATLITLFLHGASASPKPQLTYVAFGPSGEVPEPLDLAVTQWASPIGTASGGEETTYLFNEIVTTVEIGDMADTTTVVTATGGTYLAFPLAVLTLELIHLGPQGLEGDEGECHFTSSDGGECVENFHGEGDILALTLSGPAVTYTLAGSE
ncbi:hypothetical protein BDP27DRAFT_1356345 [Rhodocollybia butyracea]|uniref:Uncharacterized protein n=1 Tax=Rhodocollybia butyracea TaxID=206335 RepID=A0A9P5UGI4_9AGAR|nr:hypothetical protein BDP27DRAFT_1356345 [Rhodocollybia butyracea]